MSRKKFQSTHPLRGATTVWRGLLPSCRISIHAPLAGCDDLRGHIAHAPDYFNPRTPCGVRPQSIARRITAIQFQSTHPLRGATNTAERINDVLFISIHAPLAGCDPW